MTENQLIKLRETVLNESDRDFKCQDCGQPLSGDSSRGRDGETMGGLSVDYYYCEKCNQPYELIEGHDEPNKCEEGYDPYEF